MYPYNNKKNNKLDLEIGPLIKYLILVAVFPEEIQTGEKEEEEGVSKE